ncbi:MAG: hypothetical protein KJ774_09125 [Firmicutes bacterium]|nr:hypothetical protein [Bacillota bacterium]
MSIDFKSACEDKEYLDFLQELVNNEMIENEAAIGITKMIIDGRVNESTEKQWYTFEKYVANEHIVENCQRCQESIPWCEMLEALDNGGYCNYCVHMMSKEGC